MVTRASTLVNRFHLEQFVGDRCRVPDHSLVNVNIRVSHIESMTCSKHDSNLNINNDGKTEHKRYNFEVVKDGFMNNNLWKDAMNDILDDLLSCRDNQEDIDNVYDHLCTCVLGEMDKYVKYVDCKKKARKQYKCTKPYWSEKQNCGGR